MYVTDPPYNFAAGPTGAVGACAPVFVGTVAAPQTGQRRWRFWTIPEPGQPGSNTLSGDAWKRGGGPTWVTGAYDAEQNLIIWGTGNPSPDWNGDVRPGDNLYSDSGIALDADTGKLKWHYQFVPHDTPAWDAVQVPVLVDSDWQGQPRKLVYWAHRNGFFYVLDRTNGQFLLAKTSPPKPGTTVSPRRAGPCANRRSTPAPREPIYGPASRVPPTGIAPTTAPKPAISI